MLSFVRMKKQRPFDAYTAKVAPGLRPGQVIVYNGWEPYMFRGGRGPMDLEPGLVKWLHLAGEYAPLIRTPPWGCWSRRARS